MSLLTKEDVRNAFYVENGIHHTNILELDGYDNEDPAMNEVILDMLHDKEIRLVLDDATIDHSTAFLLYRKDDRLLMEYMFKGETDYEFMLDGCEWVYPKNKMLLFKDKADLVMLLNDWSNHAPFPIKIVSLLKKPIEFMLLQTEKDKVQLSEKQANRIISLAKWIRNSFYVYIVLLVVIERIFSWGIEVVFVGLGAYMFMLGAYLLIGSLLHFRPVYCFNQLLNHQEMTPNEIFWNSMKKSELYAVPIAFMIFGMGSLIVGILGLLEIITL